MIWRKLDCLNLNLQVTKSSVRRKDAWNRRPSCIGMALGSMHPPGWERCPARAFKEMSEAPTSRSTRMTRTNVGSPTGREPYGDTGPVVVVGVTPHQGGRESRPQGEGGQVIGHLRAGRYA